jgi:tRNA(fMet)-specific endonuclease VapC
MGLILDADVIIRGEKGTFDLVGWLNLHKEELFEVAAITVAELWHGVERATGNRRARRDEYLRAVLSSVFVLPYTEITAFEHARIWAFLSAEGKMPGYYDLIVAATAIEHDSTVVTFNKRHFEDVPALKVITP